jgi:hypothetical protein
LNQRFIQEQTKNMKIQKTLWLSLAVVFTSFSLFAQDQKLLMTLQASCKEINDQGNVVRRSMNTKTIIDNCAADNGLTGTNRPPLALVYRVGSGSPRTDYLEVVNKTNGAVICTVASLSGGVSITNSSGTQLERQALLSEGSNLADVIGSAIISEKLPGGDVNKRKIQGKVQFGSPGETPEICSGNFSTSKVFVTP